MSKLLLSKEIYPYPSIAYAAKQFKTLCHVKIHETDGYHVCSFSKCIYDEHETISEFENYVIDAMNAGL